MCEFCGCEMGRSVERHLRQRQPKGKALGVRVVAVATGLTELRAADATLGEVTRRALEPLAAEYVASGGV